MIACSNSELLVMAILNAVLHAKGMLLIDFIQLSRYKIFVLIPITNKNNEEKDTKKTENLVEIIPTFISVYLLIFGR